MELPARQDNSIQKEVDKAKIHKCLFLATHMSHGAAIVEVSSLPYTQDEIASALLPTFYKVSVDDILSHILIVPEDANGLVVTGYSDKLFHEQNGDVERRIQGAIRAAHNERFMEKNLAVIVLSDTLPNINVFHNATMPWFNGPFEGDDAVWSLKQGEYGFELVRFERKTDYGEGELPSHWDILEDIPFV